jgi:ppGpp synthetase/RelA/SpoT-type nucleotidyltranferase
MGKAISFCYPKDHYTQENRGALWGRRAISGHRTIEYTIGFKEKGARLPFEVQIMTQLQHAWDKKDHHLIYEYIRAGQGDRIPVQLKNRVADMSELLYAADTIFDEILEEITTIMN